MTPADQLNGPAARNKARKSLLYSPGRADPPLGRVGSHERGNRDRSIPGTRGGAGDGAGPGRLVARGRRAGPGHAGRRGRTASVARRTDGAHGRRRRRRHHRRGPPPRSDGRRVRAGRPRPRRQQRRDARRRRRSPRSPTTRSTSCASPSRSTSSPRSAWCRTRCRCSSTRRSHASQRDVGRRRGGLRGLGWLRRRQGGARASRRRARRGVPDPDRVVGRSRRSAHGDAPGRVPRRGHLGPARAEHAWCPASSSSSAATARAAATAPPSSSRRERSHERADGAEPGASGAGPPARAAPAVVLAAARARGAVAARVPRHDPRRRAHAGGDQVRRRAGALAPSPSSPASSTRAIWS